MKESIKNELAQYIENKEELISEIEILVNENLSKESIQSRQDQILHNMFEGKYGSDEENHLEMVLDDLEEKRKIIQDADFRWKQAEVLTMHSQQQLQSAVDQWAYLGNISRVEDR